MVVVSPVTKLACHVTDFLDLVYEEKKAGQPSEDWSKWFDSKNYNEDGSPKLCRECGNDHFTEVPKDSIDGHICEISVHCSACFENVAYWAYGWYDPCYANLHPTEGP